MAKKSKKAKAAKKSSKKSYTPDEIVEKWRNRIVSRLGAWELEEACFTTFEPKLRKNIQNLMDAGQKFTPKSMEDSLRVAGDMAKIFKILQPEGFSKIIDVDTFEAVLALCATSHMVCQDAKLAPGLGSGGWCTV